MTFTNICIKFLPFFFQQLKITANNFVSEIISRCFWPLDASGDANSVYSCRSLYGSSRTVRYLDADNSFSVPVVPLLLFCYVSRALLLPLSPAPLRIPPFSFFRRAAIISLMVLLYDFGTTWTARLCVYIFYCCEPPTFFRSIFLFYLSTVDECLIFFFISLHIFIILFSSIYSATRS